MTRYPDGQGVVVVKVVVVVVVVVVLSVVVVVESSVVVVVGPCAVVVVGPARDAVMVVGPRVVDGTSGTNISAARLVPARVAQSSASAPSPGDECAPGSIPQNGVSAATGDQKVSSNRP